MTVIVGSIANTWAILNLSEFKLNQESRFEDSITLKLTLLTTMANQNFCLLFYFAKS